MYFTFIYKQFTNNLHRLVSRDFLYRSLFGQSLQWSRIFVFFLLAAIIKANFLLAFVKDH